MFTRVLYDVAELGPYAQTGHGGIRRTIENVSKRLLLREDVDVRFSGLSYREASRHAPFLTERGHDRFRYGGVELLDRISDVGERSIAKLLQRRMRAQRAARRLIAPLQNTSRQRSFCVSPRALREVDVYHSPFRPLPRISAAHPQPAFFITVYDLIPITHPSFAGEFFCKAARNILASITPDSCVLCISGFVKDQLCDYLKFPPERVFVTPLAASTETFHRAEPAAVAQVRARYELGSGPYLLSVGANDARKNIPHLIECFGRVVRSGELADMNLVLVGTRNDIPTVEALFARYPELRSRIVFTGYVPNDDLAPIYSGAAAFAFPSLVEGFGLPPLEAMQCGTPVICSNAASLPEVIGDAGLLLPPTDHDAWCNAIIRTSRDETLRQDLQRKSAERAACFSWDITTDVTVRAYQTALAVRERSAGRKPRRAS